MGTQKALRTVIQLEELQDPETPCPHNLRDMTFIKT